MESLRSIHIHIAHIQLTIPPPPPPILPMHGIKFVEIFFKLSDLFILLISFQAINLVLVIENFHPMVVINTLR